MSNNASRNSNPAHRRRNLRQEAELADFGLDGSMSLEDIANEVYREKRYVNRRVSYGGRRARHVSQEDRIGSLGDVLAEALGGEIKEESQDLSALISTFEGVGVKTNVYTLRSGHDVSYEETMLVDHHHLMTLVEAGARSLAKAWWPEMLEEWRGGFGHIPHNFALPDHSPWGGWNFYNSRRRFVRMEMNHAEAAINGYLRTAGFLQAAAKSKFPGLKKALEKTQSLRGANSPYTYFSVFQLAQRLRSPGRAERLLWKVKRRAEAIFSAYVGDNAPSWRSIAEALLVTQQIGKAAVIAVAGTLSGRSFSMYRDARQWLVDYHLCKVEDDSDGVISKREQVPRLVKFGVEVYRIAIPQLTRRGYQVGVDFQWLVRTSEGRTYHSHWGGAREALQDALRAWKRQDELAVMEAEFIGFLKGEMGFCPLVVRQDSYSAGNCSAGTESWLRERGWADRAFIPAIWLIPHLDYGLVRNVAMNLYRRHSENK